MRKLCSFFFWLPIDAVINRFHGYTFRETYRMYRLGWKFEQHWQD